MPEPAENIHISDRLKEQQRYVVPKQAILDTMCMISIVEMCFDSLTADQQLAMAGTRHLPVVLWTYFSELLGCTSTELQVATDLRLAELEAGIIGDYRR